MTTILSKNKRRPIDLGSFVCNPSNSGGATATYNIQNLIPDWQSATIDNFFPNARTRYMVQINVNDDFQGWVSAYDPTTGILSFYASGSNNYGAHHEIHIIYFPEPIDYSSANSINVKLLETQNSMDHSE